MQAFLGRQPMLVAAMSASQDCVKLVSLSGEIVYINACGCRLLDVEGPDTVLGRRWADFWPADARPRIAEALARGAAAGHDRFVGETPTAFGPKHWDVVVTPLVENGKVIVLLVTSRDISDLQAARAEAEAKQHAVERQAAALRSAGRIAKIGGWEIDAETSEVHWSDEIWELLGGTPRPIGIGEAMEIYAEHDRDRVGGLLNHAIRTGERVTFEADVHRFDGSAAAIRVFGELHIASAGRKVLRGAAQDISEMREAQDSLARAEQRLRMAVEMADMLVYEVDYRRRRLFHEGSEQLFFERGLTYEEMRQDPFMGIDPRDREAAIELWDASQRTGAPYRAVYRVARSDGKEIWAFSTARLESDAQGKAIRLVGALQDITATKQAEQDLRAARDMADAANAAKSAFLANVSHEIRTPLNGILGMAQVMARSDPAERHVGHLEVIRRSGETLMSTLNDVLDLSKIEAGRLELEVSDFALRDTVEAACAPFVHLAAQKDLAFTIGISPEAEGVWRGDALRLRQVLTNLLSNAVKFTDAGAIHVSASCDDAGLGFAVSDSGMGITPAQQTRLFTPFWQGDASITRRFGGTGLGLAISRELVRLMDGELSVRSTPGSGATFHFHLPLAKGAAEAGQRSADTSAPDRPLRILTAEDNPTNQLVLQALLEPLEAELVQVADGEAAVAAAASGGFDLILMDIQMPGMSGVEATMAIRRREAAEGRPPTPIVALTANVMTHQVEEYRAAGMTGHVAKPINAERLFVAIACATAETQDVAA